MLLVESNNRVQVDFPKTQKHRIHWIISAMNVLLIIILIHIKSGMTLTFSFSQLLRIPKTTFLFCRSLRARDLFFDDTTHDNKGRIQKQAELF